MSKSHLTEKYWKPISKRVIQAIADLIRKKNAKKIIKAATKKYKNTEIDSINITISTYT